MVQDVLAREPQLRVRLQHVDDQIAHAVPDVVPVRCREVEEPVEDRVKQLLLLVVRRHERREAAQQNVQDDAGRPDVDLWKKWYVQYVCKC